MANYYLAAPLTLTVFDDLGNQVGDTSTLAAGSSAYLPSGTLQDAANAGSFGLGYALGTPPDVDGYVFDHVEWSLAANLYAAGTASSDARYTVSKFWSETDIAFGTTLGDVDLLSGAAVAGGGWTRGGHPVAPGYPLSLTPVTQIVTNGGFADLGTTSVFVYTQGVDTFAANGNPSSDFQNFTNVLVQAQFVYTPGATSFPGQPTLPLDITQAMMSGQPSLPLDVTQTAPGQPTVRLDISQTAGAAPALVLDITQTASGQPFLPFDFSETSAGQPALTLDISQLGYALDAAQMHSLMVVVGGVDVSARLTGAGSIEWEEGSARIAEMRLLPGDSSVNPAAWVGLPVSVDIGRVDAGANGAGLFRRFTGVVDVPQFDPLSHVTTLRCTDDLQSVIGRLTAAQIATVMPSALYSVAITGLTSSQTYFYNEAETVRRTAYDYAIQQSILAATTDAAVTAIIEAENATPYQALDPEIYATQFYALADAWNYGQALVSTLQGHLDLDAYQTPRYTPWAPKATPDLSYTTDSINDGTLAVEISHRAQVKNTVRVSFTHRLPRCKCRGLGISYTYPFSYDQVMQNGYSIPSQNMVKQALQGTGWEMRSAPSWTPVAAGSTSVSLGNGTSGVFYMSPQSAAALTLGFTALVQKRYVQWVDNQTYAVVRLPSSVAALGEKSETLSGSIAVAFDGALWERAATLSDTLTRKAAPYMVAATAGEQWVDWYGTNPQTGAGAAANALNVLVAQAKAKILASHRRNFVKAEVDFDPQIDVDKTVSISTPQLTTQGKIRGVRDTWDLDRGAVATTFTVALLEVYGNGVPSEPTLPLETTPPTIPPGPFTLNNLLTHVGGTATATALQSEWFGYFCNATSGTSYSVAGQTYPVQFSIRTPEIEAPSRNNLVLITPQIIDMDLAADPLVING